MSGVVKLGVEVDRALASTQKPGTNFGLALNKPQVKKPSEILSASAWSRVFFTGLGSFKLKPKNKNKKWAHQH